MKSLNDLAGHWMRRHPESLTDPELRALQSSIERRPISRNINDVVAQRLTTGARLADAVAHFGGSWTFIIGFCVFMVLWTGLNIWLALRAFDPYPFIFLNLVLSMLAALQAPVIMMAQNRQAEHDRIDATHDYEVNLKAEIEIMALHDKLDQLRNDQIMVILERVEALTLELHRIERQGPAEGQSAEHPPAGGAGGDA